jgi:hypothetical protein
MKSSTKAKFGLDEKDQCPRGTVPIRRTSKDELIRAKSYFSNVLLQNSPDSHVSFFSIYIYNFDTVESGKDQETLILLQNHMFASDKSIK